jgi:Xaa-Pro aminopeptidase
MNTCKDRVLAIQQQLQQLDLHALIVPSSDPHFSEYLTEHWQGRAWLSGFDGSVGTLIITREHAALFADSRYWTQAESQLQGSGIALEKIHSSASPRHVEWMVDRLQAGQTVAVDGRALSVNADKALRAALQSCGASLRTDVDVLSAVWLDRPPLPRDAIYEHLAPHATTPRAEKLSAVRQAMTSLSASHHFVSTLDDIAWLLNLRGSDVNYNPVFLAHLLLTPDQATLFVLQDKVLPALTAQLAADHINVAPYEAVTAALAELPSDARLCIDPDRCAVALTENLPASVKVIHADHPSTLLKSRKTDAELQHWRRTMELDGAAMCEFYAEFEALLANPDARGPITELTVDTLMYQARAAQAGFVGASFATIAGYNANGAMPHYRATQQSHARIEGQGLLLIDSGGQYLGGTTDITRVWPIGEPSAAQRRDYTLVLKGMMALSRTRFPRGTLSPMLDSIARAPLWAHGLDFGHGTGHGVGYFLNVHEGPQSFSRSMPKANMAMQAGMVTSIEPGIYRPGLWGIRIENLVAAVPDADSSAAGFGDFLAFETLTLCPIDTQCIERELLSSDEIDWLNRYHASVRERLRDRVSGAALAWLLRRTEPY